MFGFGVCVAVHNTVDNITDFLTASSQIAVGFPDNSVGKESACKAGDPGLIPGSGQSAGEGKDYPLQYSGLGIPWTIQSMGFKESETTEQLSLSHQVKQEGLRL